MNDANDYQFETTGTSSTASFLRFGAYLVAGTQNYLHFLRERYETSDPQQRRKVKAATVGAGILFSIGAVRGLIPSVHVMDRGNLNVPGDGSIINIIPATAAEDRTQRQDSPEVTFI